MASISINTTQLKCACLDLEWRQRWIEGMNPPVFSMPCKKSFKVHGQAFHQIVEKFINAMTLNSFQPDHIPTQYEELWEHMWENQAKNRVHQLLEDNEDLQSVNHLVECLKSFCRHIHSLYEQAPFFQSWNQIFYIQEFSIQDAVFPVGEDHILISGKVDAVRNHPKRGLEIVDYKLSHGSNLEQDLLQIAIYSQLLRFKKPGVNYHGLLEYYEPEVHETCVRQEELTAIFRDNVEPVFKDLILQSQTGKRKEKVELTLTPSSVFDERRIKETGIEKSETGISTDDAIDETDILAEKIKKCFASFHLDVEVINAIDAPQLIRYQIRPGVGVKAVSLANRADDLMVQLELTNVPHIQPDSGFVAVDVPKRKPKTIWLRDIINSSVMNESFSPLTFPLGININNRLLTGDLCDSNTCHVLIGGMTGSGKSEFLKSMIFSLMKRNSPQTLQMTLIDPKILSFHIFRDSPFLQQPVITDIELSIETLDQIVEEMERRYQQLAHEGYDQLLSRYKDGKTDIPFMIVFVDEFGDLILSDKEKKKIFEDLISRIAQKGRAAGIHLVLATQRPEAKVVTGLIKANLPLKICLRVNTRTNSDIILDQSGGQNLLGKGDMLCSLGLGLERVQAPFIPNEQLSVELQNMKLCV